jgi:predicted nucleotidyltransferase
MGAILATMPATVAQPLPAMAISLPLDQVRQFCERWQVDEFALFGSVLRADFRPDSDVDVMVAFSPAARHSLYELSDMREELAAMFGRPVDLVTRQGVTSMVNWYRRRAILDSVRVVYAR